MTCVFDLLVVGSGGGPDETNLSAYLLKTVDAKWEDGIIALEAGSGQGALRQLLKHDSQLLDQSGTTPKEQTYSASEIYSFVRSYLVTHAHLDHINSLVLSAGSLRGPRKKIHATKQTLQDLETIFSDRLWPNLASWKESDEDYKFLYNVLDADGKYHPIHSSISVRSFPLSHGTYEDGSYTSSAFCIRHDPSSTEFLFFGDVEPDSVASTPRTIDIWRTAAPRVPETIKAVFIECSWPSGRSDDMLYGHLTPEHLVTELVVLAKEVVAYRKEKAPKVSVRPARKRQKINPIGGDELIDALKGLRVYVMHCKDDMTHDDDTLMRHLITKQVKELVKARKLGAIIECAEPGMRISI
ncbi:cyclic-AMP phosphodiesterase [Macrolepiota fuliginosa MF-IS2]|uniref:Cyclic-AMP phosphodiesterase n=1 Tax=Macrolepiota fuliginosa MF-IS2 TaxID=1400762 RepID=A0A9P5XLV4_9AGAR|nr:cyclic-AMP phosphodiesterase [Macrolepiota fuliginosa MF-IS2]